MTVNSPLNKNAYIADGVITVFSYTFYVINEVDLQVFLDDIQQVSGFTVAGIGDENGGTVTFDTAPANEVIVTLLRIVPLTQKIDFEPFGPFPAEVNEQGLDLSVMRDQQIDSEQDNTVRASPLENPLDFLPPVAERAGFTLAFDEFGNPVVGTSVEGEVVKLDDLSDVTLTDPEDKEVLRFNSGAGQWINDDLADAFTIDDASDVVVSSPQINDLLLWSGSEWANGSLPGALIFIGEFDPVTGVPALESGVSGGGVSASSGFLYKASDTGLYDFPTATPGSGTQVNEGDDVIWSEADLLWSVFSTGTVVAAAVFYDNSASGLAAVEVQSAIDEMAPAFTAVDAGQLSNRNVIINGAMQVNQRGLVNENQLPADSNRYGITDTWQARLSAGLVAGWTADSETNAANFLSLGFNAALRMTVETIDAAPSASAFIATPIEDLRMAHYKQGTNDARTVVLSFYAKTNTPGTYCASLKASGGRRFSFNFSLAQADVIQRITKVLTLDTNSGSRPTYVKDVGLVLEIYLAINNATEASAPDSTWFTPTGQLAPGALVNFLASVGNTFTLTGAQLEPGKQVTNYEMKAYDEELLACFRYYWRWRRTSNRVFATGIVTGANAVHASLNWPVRMRQTPVWTNQTTDPTDWTIRDYASAGVVPCTSVPRISEEDDTTAVLIWTAVGHGAPIGGGVELRAGPDVSRYSSVSAEMNAVPDIPVS